MYYRVDLQAQFEARTVLAELTAAEKAGHQRAISSSRRMAEVNRLRPETAHFLGFGAAVRRAESGFAQVVLAEGEELWSNPLCVRFQ
jgi:hypothetical protein